MRCSTLISVSRQSTRELSLKSFSFALKAVYSGAIEAISFKALRAVAVAVCAGALKAAAVAVCIRALEATTAAITAAVARVTRSYLGLLRPLGVLMVPNLRFSR